jgi:tetratricopeptide (TPR) repeat protein
MSRHPPATPDPSGDYEEKLGLALRGLGDAAGARRQFELALERAQKEAEAGAAGHEIHRALSMSVIGYRLALLGQEREALENLHRAVELVPFEQDTADGLEILQSLAMGQAALGRDDEAIASLERMFARPAGVAPGNVWLAPEFAALRANPKFRALMAREGVDVNLDPYDARSR